MRIIQIKNAHSNRPLSFERPWSPEALYLCRVARGQYFPFLLSRHITISSISTAAVHDVLERSILRKGPGVALQ
jgi:hypothetical protein